MPFDYDPKDASSCLPEGEYDAVLKSVIDGRSKSSGQPMQTWTLEVYGEGGRKRMVDEYVTAASTYKIKQLASALGLKADFEAGTFQADDHAGANLRVHLMIEEQDGYDDKNRIKKYLPPALTAPTPEPSASRQVSAPRGGQGATERVSVPAGGSDVSKMRQQIRDRAPAQAPFAEEQHFDPDSIPF